MREIALHMADIAENSLAAGAARIKLSVMIDRAADSGHSIGNSRTL